MIRSISLALQVLAALLCLPPAAQAQDADRDRAGAFDFYVLALSWSPAYCTLNRDRADPQQCGADQSFRFIVHGLWPQHERGWPDFCPLPRGNQPSRQEVQSMLGIMPSRGLVQHQWRKHGTCSGLSPANYFDLTRQAFDKIRIPDIFTNSGQSGRISPQGAEAAFAAANPGLAPEGMAISCNRGLLTEVRICLTKDLEFRNCPAVDRSGCRSPDLELPAP